MKRIALSIAVVIVAGAFLISAGGASNGSPAGTYKIEFDNAFGLVTGADFKVAGVRAGAIKSIDLDQKTLHAVVTVSVTEKGFGEFHSDAFCQSRPQSLIGEYFVDCSPGTTGKVFKPGSTIPVQNTQSTIAADLAVERVALQQTWHKFPAFLEALKPNMQALGASADAQIPSLTNLNASAQQLSRLFTDLPGFANASKPAISSLGQAGVTGKQALTAAKPTIADLSKF